jgi:hypothetical protein
VSLDHCSGVKDIPFCCVEKVDSAVICLFHAVEGDLVIDMTAETVKHMLENVIC